MYCCMGWFCSPPLPWVFAGFDCWRQVTGFAFLWSNMILLLLCSLCLSHSCSAIVALTSFNGLFSVVKANCPVTLKEIQPG